MKDFPIIRIDNNFVLTNPSLNHLSDLFEVYNNVNTSRQMNCVNITCIEDIKNRINTVIKGYESNKQLYWVIYSDEIAKAIGYISILFHANVWQLEYALNELFWNKGIMYSCLNMAIPFIKENSGYKIIALVNTNNDASIRILEKLQFMRTRTVANESKFPSTEFIHYYLK